MRKYMLIFLWIFPCLLKAQDLNPYNNIIPPNPDAASLAKYADFPVDLSTGTVQISIPLWNIKCGDIDVPISLSYHASGIPVAETPSYVGLGWTLNAGGAIMRTIRGLADDGMLMYPDNGGPMETTGLLIDYPSYAITQTNDSHNPSKYREAAVGKRDLEPDMFYYNFANLSGKFVFDFNGTPHLIPRKNYIIEKELNPSSSNNRIIKWTITTDDGVKYYFEEFETTKQDTKTEAWTKNGNNLKASMISNSHTTKEHNSSWVLTKIELPNSSKFVLFEYDDITIDNPYPVSDSYVKVDYFQATPTGGGPGNPITDSEVLQNLITHHGTDFYEETQTSSTIIGKRIRKIIAPDQTVEFLPGDYRQELKGDRVLDKIVIRDGRNEIVKQFKLSYSYFSSTGMATLSSASPTADPKTGLRLSLNKIQELDKSNSSLPPYIFEYENHVWLPDRLFSKAQDHWGYYNGHNENTSLIPYLGSVRDASNDKMKAGSLVKITYPTGGYTQFNYEANTVFQNGITQTVGGLRIKEKIDYDPISNKSLFKQYNYDLSENHSSGYVGYVPYYSYTSYASGFSTPYVWNAGYHNYASTSNSALNNGGEGIICYEKVTVIEGNDETGINGKTENCYTLLQSVSSPCTNSNNSTDKIYVILGGSGPAFPFGPPISGAWGCGLLKSQYIFKYKNNSFYKIKEIQNTYKNDYWGNTNTYNTATDVLAAKVGVFSTNDGDENGVGTAAVQFYYIPSRNINLTKTVETDYDNNEAPTTSKITDIDYEDFSPYIYPRAITTTNSNGNIIKTVNTYPGDYTYFNGFVKAMIDEHMLKFKIEEKNLKNGKVLYSIHNRYTSTTPPVLESIYGTEITQPVNENSFYGIDNLGNLIPYTYYKEKISFDKYDTYGNLLQYHKKNDLSTSYIWGYNKQYPIAKASNASSGEIAYTSFETSSYDNWSTKYGDLSSHIQTPGVTGNNCIILGNISGDQLISPLLDAGTYNIELYAKTTGGPMIILNETVGMYVPSSSVFNLCRAKVVLSSQGTISLKPQSPMYIDEIRIFPVDAQMITYTYNPPIGITSIMNPNGVASYYEYDSFGRLKNVRNDDQNITSRNYYHYYTDTYGDGGTLTISPSGLHFLASGGTANVSVSSNTSWTISEKADWIFAYPLSGSGNGTITVPVMPNTTGVRSGSITITTSNGTTQTIYVIQE